jgi:hypothetical protein
MRFLLHRAPVLLQSVLVLAFANGCHATPVVSGSSSPSASSQLAAARVPAAASQQLIVKFKRAAVSCDQTGIARFSQAAGVQLELVRPMSGEACVVVQFGAGAAELARGLDSLRKNPAVEWAEPDAVMRTQ